MSPLADMSVQDVVTVAASAASLLALAAIVRERRRRTPPSVGRYPLIGSHLHLPEPWHRTVYERFGNEPIVVIHQGTVPVYLLNNWTAFKEAMLDNAEELTGRISQFGSKMLFGDIGGIVPSDGELWREYRRFTLRVLRDFGLGRRGSEKLISDEAGYLCNSIDDAAGAGLDTNTLMSTATSNIICQLVFGSRVASEDPDFDKILELFRGITQNEDTNMNNSVFLSMLPIIEKFPIMAPLFTINEASKRLVDDFKNLLDYCKKHMERHEAEMANVNEAKDYIEAHLMHQRQHPEMFNDLRLTFAVSDLFVAGTDTTANTLRWALLLMIQHPHIADKVRKEIHDQVGRERQINLSDKQKLPYVMATIEEVMRKSSLIALGLMHRVTSPIKVAGYPLAKDTICAFNVYAIHHDPAYFPQPSEFRPERHLTSDGRQFVPCEQLATFGLGKRACLGEGLAKAELFVFFATLMQRYRFQLHSDEQRTVEDLLDDPNLFKGSVMRSPPKHKLSFTRI